MQANPQNAKLRPSPKSQIFVLNNLTKTIGEHDEIINNNFDNFFMLRGLLSAEFLIKLL